MKTVMAFGTFDNLHAGHLSYLRQAKDKGDNLIVIIARNMNVKAIKGKAPRQNEKIRLAAIKKLNFVDQAVLGEAEDRMKVVKRLKPDIIFLGYDQKVNISELKSAHCGIILRGKAYKEDIYKSSKLVVGS